MTAQKHIAVTIDGPAGAGKSTVAKAVAKRLGYLYIDTGALYRAVAWLAAKRGLTPNDAEAVERMIGGMDIRLEQADRGVRVWVNDQEITGEIRTPEISQLASALSALPGVRARLLDQQRAFRAQDNVVAEGRDMGTVVFPDAACKIYLDASLEERAKRRLGDLRGAGGDMTMEAMIEEVRVRDERDTNRAHAPLRAAEDAHIVDTTDLTINQVVDRIAALARAAAEHAAS